MFTWGLGTDGQLGHKKIEFKTGALGKYYIQEVPRRLVKSRRFRRIAVGNTSTIAVTHDGQLFGWGVNFIGGNHSSLEPVPIEVPVCIYVCMYVCLNLCMCMSVYIYMQILEILVSST